MPLLCDNSRREQAELTVLITLRVMSLSACDFHSITRSVMSTVKQEQTFLASLAGIG